jgi:hypothetical protein
MRLDNVIELLDVSEIINENGFSEIQVTTSKTDFVNKGSVKSNEFYAAAQSGFALEIMFTVLTWEYSNQKYVEFEAKRYKIIRTYEKGKYTEIICQAYDEGP